MPHGLKGNALAHVESIDDDDDMGMGEEEGWQSEYTQWWFDFLNEKGGKGVSKDTWAMVRVFRILSSRLQFTVSLQFLDFVRSIDAKFEKYDPEGTSSYVIHFRYCPEVGKSEEI